MGRFFVWFKATLEVKIILRLRYFVAILALFPVVLAVGSSPAKIVTSPEGFTVEIFYGKPFMRTLPAMIADLGVTLYPEDSVKVFPDPAFGLGGRITIVRATPVWIDDGGKRFLARTFKKTVGELLEEKGLILGEKDTIDPPAGTAILAEATIKITRVEETEIVEKRSIPFKTVTVNDPTLFEYTSWVEKEGKNGTRELRYRVRRENGVEVARTLLGDEMTAKPDDKIVLRGTKPLPVYQVGIASWYNHPRYDGYFAAHPTLSYGTKVLVKNTYSPERKVVVTIVDRGPWGAGRVIDLEPAAFQQLAPLGAGLVSVTLHIIP